VEFLVLGEVGARSAGQPVDCGPLRQRSVLAALLVDAGRPVPAEELIDRVWGEAVPQRVRHTLHTYLAKIRQVLARPGDSDVVMLSRRSGAYLLDVPPDHVDMHRFRTLVEQARTPACAGPERLALLRQALELWRGVPLAGIPGEWAGAVRQALHRQRLDAVVAWAHAEALAGDPATAVGPLTELVADTPLVEPLVEALMLALSGAGRNAEALECFTTARRRLVAELGVEPGPLLQQAHRSILLGEIPSTAAVPRRPVPAQLPATMSAFVGRCAELGLLDADLAAPAAGPRAPVIRVVSGTGGVGKTALVVHWAHRVRDRFPDGQLYVNLRGFGPRGPVVEPVDVLHRFLDALGVPASRIPQGLDARADLYRTELAGRRVLVVLDNALYAEHVRPLLPGGPAAVVVVTSRNRLGGLSAVEGARLLSLDVLTRAEARELLVARLGERRVADQPAATNVIISRCGGLPLALAVVAGRASTVAGHPLDRIAGELADLHTGLDALADHDAATDVRAVFSWSYRTLAPDSARLFRLLALAPSPEVRTATAASLAGVPLARARRPLAELHHAHLITEHHPGSYQVHELLRAYALELHHRVDGGEQRQAARRRILDHYLHTAACADRLLNPQWESVELPPVADGVTVENLSGGDAALAWFTAEHRSLLACVGQAADDGLDRHAWQLARSLATFLDRQGHWSDLAASHATALAAAVRLGDPAGHAHVLRGLGRAQGLRGDMAGARRSYERAATLFDQVGDHGSRARTLLNLSWVAERLGDQHAALRSTEQALDLCQRIGNRVGTARALNGVGWCRAKLGEYRDALVHCGRSLALNEQAGDRQGQANAWDSLGYAHHHLGRHDRAVACYRRAVDLYRQVGDVSYEAGTRARLGDAYQAAGHLDAATHQWRHALTILDTLRHAEADHVRARLRRLRQPGDDDNTAPAAGSHDPPIPPATTVHASDQPPPRHG